jgi:signal transduction histidine kinase
VEEIGAQHVKPEDGPIQQRPDNRFGGRVPGQRIQITLHGGGGVIFAHREYPPNRGGILAEFVRPRVHLSLLVKQPEKATFGLPKGEDSMTQTLDREQAIHSNQVSPAYAYPAGLSGGVASEPESSRHGADRREEFLAMILHELRGPLGNILTAVAVLRDAEDCLPQHRWVWDGVERATQQVQRLSDDLLGLCQTAQPTFQLRLEPLDLAGAAHAAVERRRRDFEREGLQIALRSGGKPVWVAADPGRLELVFGNLLDNAAKYTEPGGQVTVSVEAVRGEAVLGVQDTGIGIAPEVLPLVFDAFVREGAHAGRPTRGSGVGLLVVRALVELHGGRVEASSAGRGRGSQFVVRLPTLGSK